ncbi:DUF72 domain-containing protein [Mucilaginibacter terrenus]|uniref:DUF72 domain-containing protein n=2 Tax=Mucilaginibacter terrenus TaxID=2482727 RepID=A0A3E2NRD1_9SPHI|nr:DUF72 domain-containing protein [Mucilaginibacter terrenus]
MQTKRLCRHFLNMDNKGNYFSGTSNLVLPVRNKEAYPPEYRDKSRLTFYGSLFTSLEVNSCFYRLPMHRTVIKWAGEVPEGFRFTYKLWKGITHNKGLEYNSNDVHRFLSVIGGANEKKGSLLVQFPASITSACRLQMERLLQDVHHANTEIGWDVAVEFRSKTWYTEPVFDLLQQLGMTAVLHDMPASATPLREQEADFVYLRFHGPEGGYRGSYTDQFLYEYAQYINEWLEDGKRVYAYFNNTMGDAVQNLMTLNSYVNGEE